MQTVQLTSRSPLARRAELSRRIQIEDGGSVYAVHPGEAGGWIVALTNNVVRGSVEDALDEVIEFVMRLTRLNPQIGPSLTVGWWRESGELFLDVGLALTDGRQALTVARVFHQEAAALIHAGGLQIVNVVAESGIRAGACLEDVE